MTWGSNCPKCGTDGDCDCASPKPMTTRAREVEAYLRDDTRQERWRSDEAQFADVISALIAECETAKAEREETLNRMEKLINDLRDVELCMLTVSDQKPYYSRAHKRLCADLSRALAFVQAHRPPPQPVPVLRCTGCGSTETLEEIRAKHPGAIACCPERDMQPVPQGWHDAASEIASALRAEGK